MSILIKGMEMPKDGVYWCEIGVVDDIATITIHGEDRKSFRLVPVPPHGRLIDADEAFIDADERGFDFWASDADIDSAKEFLKAQPTIIEAEEGDR